MGPFSELIVSEQDRVVALDVSSTCGFREGEWCMEGEGCREGEGCMEGEVVGRVRGVRRVRGVGRGCVGGVIECIGYLLYWWRR